MSDTHRQPDDHETEPDPARPERGGQPFSEHPWLEAFNADEAIDAPGTLDDEISPTSDAELPPPQ